MIWRRRKPQPMAILDGDTLHTPDGESFILARIPDTPADINPGPAAHEANAYYRGMAVRRMSFMAAHMMAGFDRDEAYDLLCQRLGWEAHQ